MKFYLLTISIFLTLFARAQQLNYLDNFNLNSKKPIVIYLTRSWCIGDVEEIHALKDTLTKYRSNYTLILIADTVNNHLYNFQELKQILQPEKFVPLNIYFPKRYSTKSERIQCSTYYNKLMGLKISKYGSGSVIVIQNGFANSLWLDDRANQLASILKCYN